MEITRNPNCLHHEFENGATTFGVYLSPESDCDDDELNEAIQKWANGDSVFLNFRFSISGCIEEVIEGRRYWGEKDVVMSIEQKPMVAALRAELLEMVSRLDEIKFLPDVPNADLATAAHIYVVA